MGCFLRNMGVSFLAIFFNPQKMANSFFEQQASLDMFDESNLIQQGKI